MFWSHFSWAQNLDDAMGDVQMSTSKPLATMAFLSICYVFVAVSICFAGDHGLGDRR